MSRALLATTWYWPPYGVVKYRNHNLTNFSAKIEVYQTLIIFSIYFDLRYYCFFFCFLPFLQSYILISSFLYLQFLLTDTVWGNSTGLVINVWLMNPYAIMGGISLSGCASDWKPVKMKHHEVIRILFTWKILVERSLEYMFLEKELWF
jgi:hypothetical protein